MTRDVATCPALIALLLVGTSGCASQSDASTKQLHGVSEQVRRLQSTTDRLEERLAALENSRVRESQKSASVANSATDIPALPVVKANAAGIGPSQDPRQINGESGEESRPLIVGEGSRIETRTATNDSAPPSASPRRTKEKLPIENSSSKRSGSVPDSEKKSP